MKRDSNWKKARAYLSGMGGGILAWAKATYRNSRAYVRGLWQGVIDAYWAERLRLHGIRPISGGATIVGERSPLSFKKVAGGFPVLMDTSRYTGNLFYVDSNQTSLGADTAGFGTHPDSPFLTIDFAVGQCTANQGDVIIVLPDHAETVSGAAGIDVDVAGVTIIGLGRGTARPTITLSAVGSTFELGAANCWVENLLFLVTDDATIVVDVNATDCTIKDCEFRHGSAKEWVTCIDVNGGGANACDRTTIIGCIFDSDAAAGASNAIGLDEVADQVLIAECTILGDFSDACIHNPTGKVLTNLIVRDCILKNSQSGDHAIELISACTGALIRNVYHTDITQATASDPGSCFSFECYHDDLADKSGVLSPVAT